jgi:NADPH:quinone reductase-like Zn-dependent oxidoreductase
MLRELICVEPATPPRLSIRTQELPVPAAGQVLVRVQATSVNPIDAKRAGGYGQRLLKLKGAGRFPLALGNDVAGIVERVGTGVTRFQVGQQVFGLVATGKSGGAHASHVLTAEANLMAVPAGSDFQMLATLPYSFTTMWLAVHSTRLRADNAASKRVLISGASGALGRLALPLLKGWNSDVTAICDRDGCEDALALGARTAVGRGSAAAAALPPEFDVVLNFGAWESDPVLVAKLDSNASGYATTVHPLMANVDRLGWLRGATASLRDFKKMQSVARAQSSTANYAWTLFKPDRAALDALAAGVQRGIYSLPVGIAKPFDAAAAVFDHVASGKPGRGILLPQ